MKFRKVKTDRFHCVRCGADVNDGFLDAAASGRRDWACVCGCDVVTTAERLSADPHVREAEYQRYLTEQRTIESELRGLAADDAQTLVAAVRRKELTGLALIDAITASESAGGRPRRPHMDIYVEALVQELAGMKRHETSEGAES